MNEEFDEIKTLIESNIYPEKNEKDIRKKLVEEVAKRVEYLMETNMELFFNHLYRMDVDEKKVMKILNYQDHEVDQQQNVYITLAELIISRQEKRLETKRKFKQSDWIDI